jgi:hypothetical protein
MLATGPLDSGRKPVPSERNRLTAFSTEMPERERERERERD